MYSFEIIKFEIIVRTQHFSRLKYIKDVLGMLRCIIHMCVKLVAANHEDSTSIVYDESISGHDDKECHDGEESDKDDYAIVLRRACGLGCFTKICF